MHTKLPLVSYYVLIIYHHTRCSFHYVRYLYISALQDNNNYNVWRPNFSLYNQLLTNPNHPHPLHASRHFLVIRNKKTMIKIYFFILVVLLLKNCSNSFILNKSSISLMLLLQWRRYLAIHCWLLTNFSFILIISFASECNVNRTVFPCFQEYMVKYWAPTFLLSINIRIKFSSIST